MPDLSRGARIRDARLKTGLSQTAFAESAGASKRAQIRYEQGEPPSADYLAALDKMGVDVSVILSGRTVAERNAALVDRMDALKETTRRSLELTQDLQKGELVRDILLADLWNKPELIEAATERYVMVRLAQPSIQSRTAESGAEYKPKPVKPTGKKR